MKILTKKCLLMYSKLLSAMIAMLGVTSCSLFRCVQPCMYGVPNENWKETDSMKSDSMKSDTLQIDSVIKAPPSREIRLMYGVPPTRYQQLIDKEGVKIETQQK